MVMVGWLGVFGEIGLIGRIGLICFVMVFFSRLTLDVNLPYWRGYE